MRTSGIPVGTRDWQSVCPRLLYRVLRVPLVTLRGNSESSIQEGMKRTVQVNVKMSPDDFTLLKKAAEKRWPDAVITNSGIVLALAKIAAKSTLTRSKG